MPLNGGDQLARGAKTAQFAGGAATLNRFEDDLIFRIETVAAKYGITDEQIAAYIQDREDGEKLPDLPTVEEMAELKVGFSVTDRRPLYDVTSPEPAAEKVRKYPIPQYTTQKPILDRVLIKRINSDPNIEIMQDGSARNRKTGLMIAAKYRQHSCTGIVLAIGDFVVMGGVKTPLEDFVRPGDRVTYGDYNSEVHPLEDEEKLIAMCDAVKLDYEADPESTRIIRVQDIRLVEHPVKPISELEAQLNWRGTNG